MNIESLHIGMKVRHPGYGVGQVETISRITADIRFEDGVKTVDPKLSELTPAEPAVAVSGLGMPLAQFMEQAVKATVNALGLERPDTIVEGLGVKWHKGKLVLHPADPTLQTKEVPIEVFFHKIVMMRNQLRVLEQKINGHDKLSDGEKVELQQYIARCYGSMTTFNALFRDRADYFTGKPE
jgi:hypothetical protein